jgi:aminomethyltransferase
MGQLALLPRGSLEDAALALETLMPIDVLGLEAGRQRYGFFTNSAGGILDDCMIANLGNHLLLVVNAARKDADEAHLRAALSGRCIIERREEHALLAIQGPAAEAVLAGLSPAVHGMRFMDVRENILGAESVVSRSGYTGEDGFEISIPAAQAEVFARKLLDDSRVAPVGLGARDSLRLEAGLCLYGSDLDAGTTPVEASLEWAIPKSRRAGGARAGGFPGSDVILHELATCSARRRVGLRSQERTPVRGGSTLYPDAQGETPLGRVTSGGFGPSVNAPVAMGYVACAAANPGTVIFADVRGKRIPVEVSALPFIKLNYKRAL